MFGSHLLALLQSLELMLTNTQIHTEICRELVLGFLFNVKFYKVLFACLVF